MSVCSVVQCARVTPDPRGVGKWTPQQISKVVPLEVVPGEGLLHEDLVAIDLEFGKWFKCKWCVSRQDPEGRYKCKKDALFDSKRVLKHVMDDNHNSEAAEAGRSYGPTGGLSVCSTGRQEVYAYVKHTQMMIHTL